jgi:uridine kinase
MYTALILISGSLRTFKDNIKYLPAECDIAVYFSNDNDTYFNIEQNDFLFNNHNIKLVLYENNLEIPNIFGTEREQNTYKQWYKLNKLFSSVKTTYDIYVRMRPDVLLTNPNQLSDLLKQKTNTLRIPYGNDRDGLNDQVCIASYSEMKHYCEVINLLTPHLGSPAENLIKLTSEKILECHINIPVERVTLDYKLVLSMAKVISISGDSGSGKTTLCKLLKPLFLFDKVLEFETDRYHKWERNDERWKTISHLNPNANFLEKLEDDTFNLKIGNSIVSVDYDHSTGKFTPPQTITPCNTILLCGLHTLYSEHVREISDLKIFIDTDFELKKEWKIKRDVNERGRSIEDVISQMESRKLDYETFILPQREFADIIINYTPTNLIVSIKKALFISNILELDCKKEIIDDSIRLMFDNPCFNINHIIETFITKRNIPSFEIHSGYSGIIQYIILVILYR